MSRAHKPFALTSDYKIQDIDMDQFINPAPHPRLDTAIAGKKTSLMTDRLFDSSGGPSPAGFIHTPANSYHLDYHQHTMQPPASDSFGQRFRKINHVLRYILVVLLIGIPLAIPVIVFSPDAVVQNDDIAPSKQYHNLVYYLFAWLLITWLCAVVSNIFIRAFPHLFRFVAGWVNPAHRKYWRVFRTLRNPVTFVGCIVGSFVSFALVSLAVLYLEVHA